MQVVHLFEMVHQMHDEYSYVVNGSLRKKVKSRCRNRRNKGVIMFISGRVHATPWCRQVLYTDVV